MNKKEYIEKYGEEKYKEYNKKRAEWNRKYRENNKEEWSAYSKEYSKSYRLKNKKYLSDYNREYCLANRDKINEQNRKRYNSKEGHEKFTVYYQLNRDKILEQRRERSQSEDAYRKRREYREKNREKRNEYNRKYLKLHSEIYKKITETHKKYCKEHKEQIKKKKDEWKKNNKSKIKKNDARKRAKRKLYGFNIIACAKENNFLSPLVWHHLSDEDIIRIPEWIHIRLGGYDKEKHRKLVLKAISNFFDEEYYIIKDTNKFEYYHSIK